MLRLLEKQEPQPVYLYSGDASQDAPLAHADVRNLCSELENSLAQADQSTDYYPLENGLNSSLTQSQIIDAIILLFKRSFCRVDYDEINADPLKDRKEELIKRFLKPADADFYKALTHRNVGFIRFLAELELRYSLRIDERNILSLLEEFVEDEYVDDADQKALVAIPWEERQKILERRLASMYEDDAQNLAVPEVLQSTVTGILREMDEALQRCLGEAWTTSQGPQRLRNLLLYFISQKKLAMYHPEGSNHLMSLRGVFNEAQSYEAIREVIRNICKGVMDFSGPRNKAKTVNDREQEPLRESRIDGRIENDSLPKRNVTAALPIANNE